DIAEAREDVAAERAALAQQRDTFRLEVKERLEKLSATADEHRGKSKKLAAAEKSTFDKQWRDYTAKRARVDQMLTTLSTTPDADWDTMRERVETQLKELEDAVDGLDDAL